MTRASRVLKWIGAGAVLLGAAPIAYADGSSTTPPHPRSARCGGEPADFAAAFRIVQAPDWALAFDAATMRVTASDLGRVRAEGTWQAAGDGALSWQFDGITFHAAAADVGCAGAAEPAGATDLTVHASTGETFEIHRI